MRLDLLQHNISNLNFLLHFTGYIWKKVFLDVWYLHICLNEYVNNYVKPSVNHPKNDIKTKKSWWHDLFFISELVLQFMLGCRFLLFLLTCHFLRILQFPAFDLCDCHDVIFRKYHHLKLLLKLNSEGRKWLKILWLWNVKSQNVYFDFVLNLSTASQ